MKILSIFLENIKSYENGPRIDMHLGVNFISGNNGSGKTTILEAIGYGIFDFCPYTDISKLIRQGCSRGKITLWFSFDDDIIYRSERKIGAGSKTWTIYEEGDETEIISGVKETKEWIQEKLGILEEADLSKIYSDIIGVGQGEITTYFKITSEVKRKDHFNPIIGVEDYREAFKKTQSIPGNIQLRLKEVDNQINQIKARTEGYDKKKSEFEDIKKQLDQIRKELADKSKEYEFKDKELISQEKIKKSIIDLENKLQISKQKILNTETNRNKANEELINSTKAKQIVKKTRTAYETYESAQKQLNEVSKQTKIKRSLENQKNELEKQYKSLSAEIKTTKNTNILHEKEIILDLSKEKKILKSMAKPYEFKINALKIIDKELQLLSDIGKNELEILDTRLDTLKRNNSKINEMEDQLKKRAQKLAKLNSNFNKGPSLSEFNNKIDSVKEKIQINHGEQTVISEKISNYKDSISKGGVCPVLDQSCDRIGKPILSREIVKLTIKKKELDAAMRLLQVQLKKLEKERDAIMQLQGQKNNFDAEENDISNANKEIKRLKSAVDLNEVNSTLRNIQHTFVSLNHPTKIGMIKKNENLEDNLIRINKLLKTDVKEIFNSKNREKTEIEKNKTSFETKNAKSEETIQKLESDLNKIKESNTRLRLKENEMNAKNKQINDIKDKLKPFSNLEKQTNLLQNRIESNKQKASEYNQNLKEAELFEKRKRYTKELLSLLKEEDTKLTQINQEINKIKPTFTEENYQQLKKVVEQLRDEKVKAGAKLEEFEKTNKNLIEEIRQMEEELAKIKKFEENRKELIEVDLLIKFIRDILNHVGKPIAQRYLNTISASANLIYTTLSDEKVALTWEEDYMIRIQNHKGIREFPQLSGGEQMCAALSIQLALAKEFSNVGMAIFDEPTTNLDETRCDFLADTIGKVRDEYGFNQLFIISHDETFSSLTEQEIRLEKSNGKTQLL